MSRLSFDLEVLRSLVLGVELGTFARAAQRLGRSTSAVSAQMKKLEEQVGAPILRKAGRGTALTPTGEVLLSYARRLLDLNDEAAHAVRGADLKGELRLGVQEDFGESLLTPALGSFARAHSRVRIEARLARNSELLEQVELGRLDLALAWDSGKLTTHTRPIGKLAMCWIGSRESATSQQWDGNGPVPLAVLDGSCVFRSAAIAALEKARIPWRLAFTSPSLSGIWAAVAAGLGVTARTRAGLPGSLKVLRTLPPLPQVGLSIHRADAEVSIAVRRLEELLMMQLEVVAPELRRRSDRGSRSVMRAHRQEQNDRDRNTEHPE
jgi:DNA-binding transcriptional LysR family regulator